MKLSNLAVAVSLALGAQEEGSAGAAAGAGPGKIGGSEVACAGVATD